MKILDPGHTCLLNTLDDDVEVKLEFVKREGENYPGNKGHHPGTTFQEVLRVLIDRAKYVNCQIPCYETTCSIELMRTIIFLMEQRAKRVKGKNLPGNLPYYIECLETCKTCGHILCDENHPHV